MKSNFKDSENYLPFKEAAAIKKSYSYQDGIALRNISEETPWEPIYKSFYLDEPKPDVGLYVVQQINLYRESKAYGNTKCPVHENFVSAVSAYAKQKRLSFDNACKNLEAFFFRTVNEQFRDVLERIFAKYGFDERPLSYMLGYERSVINKVRTGERTAPKKMLYALALFLEYDLEQCEQFFSSSPHPLHNCFPDNIFRAYVESDNRSLQPFIDICVTKLRKENEARAYAKEKQAELYEFFKPEYVYSYFVVSDFMTENGYDFSTKKIAELRESKAKVRRIYDDRLDIEQTITLMEV